jgi:hypothetical protein
MIKQLKSLFSSPAEEEEAEVPDREAPRPAGGRGYTVGWILQEQTTSIMWSDPKPVRPEPFKNSSAKSVTQCPAVLDFDKRYFVIECPIDLHMRLSMKDGEIGITNMLWDKSPIRPEALQKMVFFQPQGEWRHPDRPVMQLMTNYVFVSDDPLYVNQYPPFLHYNPVLRPGVQISGRFPVDIWTRGLQWAFEWHDTSKDLILKRGEPLFYVGFDGPDPTAPIRLVEAERTPELMAHIESLSGISGWVTQTYSLFKTARERRPERLLVPKERKG